ncbi:MAG TPA: metallophosphoesterase [Thermoplasmata archaeon]|nr:metallophosphoesterase [Thermoplasmata archaeon]
MERARTAPVPGEAALLLRGSRGARTLVVSDLHLGLGAVPGRPRGPPEGDAADLADRLVQAARSAGSDGVIVAGDAKHPIVGTPGPLRPVVFDFFATLLDGGLRVELVLGNHDAGIVPHLPREVRVAPAEGVVRHGVGIFHGHRWPSEEVLAQRLVVVGHLHPGVRLAPTESETQAKVRCWVRARRPSPVLARPRERRSIAVREVIVLPAFNPIAGTEALNRDRPQRGRTFLVRRFLAGSDARAYLLDGTDLGGVIRMGLSVPPTPTPGGARPGR